VAPKEVLMDDEKILWVFIASGLMALGLIIIDGWKTQSEDDEDDYQ